MRRFSTRRQTSFSSSSPYGTVSGHKNVFAGAMVDEIQNGDHIQKRISVVRK
ncbi:MAG: hypothetical protein SOR78_03360 [Baileyella intestinalis]|nr:hypothetical protein [Baileyella intestinalis]